MKKPRMQCAKCPWKITTDPYDIPDGYDVEKHKALRSTINEGLGSLNGPTRMMSCHEHPLGNETPCVGWLANQLGPGNNLGLRVQAAFGKLDANFKLDGEQHGTFDDTLPS